VERACPSGRARVGAYLLAVHTAGGMAYVTPTLPVTSEFLAMVEQTGGAAESRFRFTEPCVASACGQWKDGGCGVIERVLAAEPPTGGALPACGIRSRCRWFAQRGAAACGVCPLVITDTRPALEPLDVSALTRGAPPQTEDPRIEPAPR
jgi:hypothetical protein